MISTSESNIHSRLSPNVVANGKKLNQVTDNYVTLIFSFMMMKFSSNFAVVMKTSSLQLPSLAGTLSIKSMLQCTKTCHFYFKNSKKIWGGGTAPSQDPSPSGRGAPSRTHPLSACGASIFAPSALTHAPPHSEVWLRACSSKSSPLPPVGHI